MLPLICSWRNIWIKDLTESRISRLIKVSGSFLSPGVPPYILSAFFVPFFLLFIFLVQYVKSQRRKKKKLLFCEKGFKLSVYFRCSKVRETFSSFRNGSQFDFILETKFFFPVINPRNDILENVVHV